MAPVRYEYAHRHGARTPGRAHLSALRRRSVRASQPANSSETRPAESAYAAPAIGEPPPGAASALHAPQAMPRANGRAQARAVRPPPRSEGGRKKAAARALCAAPSDGVSAGQHATARATTPRRQRRSASTRKVQAAACARGCRCCKWCCRKLFRILKLVANAEHCCAPWRARRRKTAASRPAAPRRRAARAAAAHARQKGLAARRSKVGRVARGLLALGAPPRSSARRGAGGRRAYAGESVELRLGRRDGQLPRSGAHRGGQLRQGVQGACKRAAALLRARAT